nr:glycine zipper 2TM domain-containing protein [uncultured Rhodoferax sp.]
MSSAMSIPGAVPAATPANRFLWVAVGALGATTLALGAVLVQVQHRSADDVASATVLPPAAAMAAVLPAPALPVVQARPPQSTAPAPEKVQKVSKPPVKYAQAAPKTIAKTVPAVAEPVVADSLPRRDQSWDPVATVPQPAPKVVCASCGTVEAVTPVQREATASGAGAAVGAVLGGLLGNQVGGGDGKTLATIAGIFGGGIAGNAVEKKMKKETVYEVAVRMEDGSLRRIEQNSPAAVGARVTVEGNTLSPALSAAPAALPGVRNAT